MSLKFALNDGTHIPWVGFGTGTALYKSDATKQVQLAIDTGFRHLDGAQMYENEKSLGDGIKAAQSVKSREELFVTTKLKTTLSPGESVESAVRESLQKLALDYVDLFLIHDPTKHDIQAVWKEMEQVKEKGLAKSIGVSNFNVENLKKVLEVATVLPAANQIEYHPYLVKEAQPILDLCKEHNIVIESYRGLSSITQAPGGPVDAPIETIRQRLEKDKGSPVTAGQVLTKWLVQKGIVVVTTSGKESRLKETLAVLSLPDLTAEEITTIEENGAKLPQRFLMKHAF